MIYKDIIKDKFDLIFIISEIKDIYQMYKFHLSVLECNQWITMLNRNPLPIEYTTDALIALKNIVNDAANYLIGVEQRFDDGELAIELMNKISKLFENEK